MHHKIKTLLIFVFLCYRITEAQISVVTDFYENYGGATGVSSKYYLYNNNLYFCAHDLVHGYELWVTNGTEEGTKLVKDIYPGYGGSGVLSSIPIFKIIYHNQLFFTATSTNGEELWKTDGTSEGTIMVKDIYPGITGSTPLDFLIYNDIIYFTAYDALHGTEFWKSDGTETGTVMVKDIKPGPLSSEISSIVEYNGLLYFSADDGVSGKELWKSDGTENGTVLFKDMIPGSGSGVDYSCLTRVNNGLLYFMANDNINGIELWRTDGTEGGTVLVKDIYEGTSGSSIKFIDTLNNQIIFLANDGLHGLEIWQTDGTNAGTIILKDIYKGSKAGMYNNFMKFGSYVYFCADDSTHGQELWKTDGSASGTQLIKDIRPGKTSSSATIYIQYKNNIYFRATDGVNGYEPWITDGTESGTKMLKNINTSGNSGASAFCISNDKLFFSATQWSNNALYVTDGSETGTQQVIDMYSGDDNPTFLCDYNGKLLFAFKHPTFGYVPCISDGSASGTKELKKISIYSGYSLGNIYSFNNDAYFTLSKDIGVYKTNGTNAGTDSIFSANLGTAFFKYKNGFYFINSTYGDSVSLVKVDFNTLKKQNIKSFAGASSANSEIFILNDTLYFKIFASVAELWKTDGTSANTTKVEYNGTSYPFNHTPVNNKIFFKAYHALYGTELWCTNGKTSYLVKDIYPGTASSFPTCIVAFKNKVYFMADDGVHGIELWSSDGTNEGTTLLKEITPTKRGAMAEGLYPVVSGNYLYFFASDSIHGYELWLTDGTTAGTKLVKDILQNNIFDNTLHNFTLIDYNGRLVFTANDYIHGIELWISDGTENGTNLIKDICPGLIGSAPYAFKVINGILYFTASDGIHGMEMWRTDGTENGTFMVDEVNPGNESSNPSTYSNVNDTILFQANSSVYGAELFRYVSVPKIKIKYLNTDAMRDSVINLGNTKIGDTSDYTLYIENKGCKDLNLTGSPVIEYVQDSSEFTVTEPNQTLLAPGGNVPFTITFTPKTVKSRNMKITINSDDHEQNVFTFYIKASGILPNSIYSKEVQEIVIYPNPVDDKLIINTDLKGKYKLCNIQGSIVSAGKISNSIINTQNIKSGIYILTVDLENQSRIIKKIIKK